MSLLVTLSVLAVSNAFMLRTAATCVSAACTSGRVAMPHAAAEPMDESAILAKLAKLRKKPSTTKAPRAAEPAREPQVVDTQNLSPPRTEVQHLSGTATETPGWLLELDKDGLSPMERLRATVAERTEAGTALDGASCAAITEFLNDFFADGLLDWVMAFTEIGETARRRKGWSGGSWVPHAARLTSSESGMEVSDDRSTVTLHLTVSVRERGKPEPTILLTQLDLPRGSYQTVDELRAGLLALHFTSDGASPEVGAYLLRLPGATDNWSLPSDLWLNTTPYTKEVRA